MDYKLIACNMPSMADKNTSIFYTKLIEHMNVHNQEQKLLSISTKKVAKKMIHKKQ